MKHRLDNVIEREKKFPQSILFGLPKRECGPSLTLTSTAKKIKNFFNISNDTTLRSWQIEALVPVKNLYKYRKSCFRKNNDPPNTFFFLENALEKASKIRFFILKYNPSS